jgi:type IV pilus assembly protein PilC
MPMITTKEKLTGKYNFVYTAKNPKGKKIKGEILSENKTVAIAALKKQGLTEIKINRLNAPNFFTKFLARKKVKGSQITVFTRQLATMQTAGIPLVQALKVVMDSATDQTLINLVARLKDEVESGGSLSESLRFHPGEFDELYCNLIEAGESSGNLDLMLQRIATYREKSETLKRKLKKAMYYPIAVLIVATIVTVLLLIKVVPTFKTMFEGFGAQLPAYTQFVLNISELIQNDGLKVAGLIGLIVWSGMKLYSTSPKFKSLIQRSILNFPVFGNILRKAAIARFARTLATTFAAGVPLPDALLLVAKASGNVVYNNAILRMRDGVSVGQRINVSMTETNVFPSVVVQMVAIGEETGSLDSMLLKVADIYEEEVDLAVDGLSTLLEPFIMLILGIIVGGLVIAMYLPVFKLGSVI